MLIAGWGNYPKIEAHLHRPDSIEAIKIYLAATEAFIVRGLGRSYGDSSLHRNILSLAKLNRMLSFDAREGILCCEAGVSLKEILDTFVPRGWFLPVTPGTKYVTVGGAIASDVHGKNHHKDGSFSDYVISLEVMTAEGTVVSCSKTQNADLFSTTCGGMGLTGIILSASFRLKRIESAYIRQTTIRTRDIEETMDLFEQHEKSTYSVAWIDCVSRNTSLGRSIFLAGEHAPPGLVRSMGSRRDPFLVPKKRNLTVPIAFPRWFLNSATARAFNVLYYHRHPKGICESIVDYDAFFYPLDSLKQWNRIYGSRGFTQYQFVLPYATSKEGLKQILVRISSSDRSSFLAVLKLFGKGNDNLLSFPMKGYTLALDFPITPGLFPLLDELDAIVLANGGRLYLSKDARMNRAVFFGGYPNAHDFVRVKRHVDRRCKLQSLQSIRLGI